MRKKKRKPPAGLLLSFSRTGYRGGRTVRFVIVTGMSGGGKSTAMRMLEDVGFFCVDNLPVPLIEKFMELLVMPGNEISKRRWGWM